MSTLFKPGSSIVITRPSDAAFIATMTWMAEPPTYPWSAIWMWGEGSDHEEAEFDSYEEAVAWSRDRSDDIRVVGMGGVDNVKRI